MTGKRKKYRVSVDFCLDFYEGQEPFSPRELDLYLRAVRVAIGTVNDLFKKGTYHGEGLIGELY